VTKGKVKISHDRYETPTLVCQFTSPTLKISIATTEVLDASRGSAGSLATRRKPVPADRPSYQITEGGSEKINVLAKLE
jgi:hypothetical protein